MNSKQMQYAITLSQIRNFSQAAQQLNMTQSALSKQIMGLEKELGVKLFDRTSSPISLTPAGEQFIRQAQELVYQEKLLMQTMFLVWCRLIKKLLALTNTTKVQLAT